MLPRREAVGRACVEVVAVVRHFEGHSRHLAVGALGVLAACASPGDASAAVVRDVRATAAESATRIVVEVEGEFRYRSRSGDDGGAIFIDIDGATLAPDVGRIVPISDQRVDGVIVLDDVEARIVRVSVDIAGRVAPRLEAVVDGSELILTLVDAKAAREPSPVAGSAQVESVRRSDPAAAKVQATAPTTAPRPATRRSVVERPLVVLDPGHGGKDPGATAWTGEFEKNIVLDLAERVARRLRKSGAVDVVMTRSGDEYVELADRRDFSRRWNADVFVSIHANASHSAAARGIETYYHSRSRGGSGSSAADREVRRLARAENGGKATRERSGTRGALARASIDAASAPALDQHAESARLARDVQTELVRQLGLRYETVRDLGAKEGPFFVIGDNAAPSVLVEAAFLTHREEGLRMRSEVYREQIAEGVCRGVLAFLERRRHPGAL